MNVNPYLIPGIIKQTSIEEIMSVVSEQLEIKKEDIIQRSRKREIVQARQILQFFAIERTNDYLRDIAYKTGVTNHATVIHSHKTIINDIQTDKYLRDKVIKIEKKLNQNETGLANSTIEKDFD